MTTKTFKIRLSPDDRKLVHREFPNGFNVHAAEDFEGEAYHPCFEGERAGHHAGFSCWCDAVVVNRRGEEVSPGSPLEGCPMVIHRDRAKKTPEPEAVQ